MGKVLDVIIPGHYPQNFTPARNRALQTSKIAFWILSSSLIGSAALLPGYLRGAERITTKQMWMSWGSATAASLACGFFTWRAARARKPK